jgi:hypothetical protein
MPLVSPVSVKYGESRTELQTEHAVLVADPPDNCSPCGQFQQNIAQPPA